MSYRYSFKKDVEALSEIERQSISNDLKKQLGISLPVLLSSNEEFISDSTLMKFYEWLYQNGYRLNKTKIEFLTEDLQAGHSLLFHGSKYGFDKIDPCGGRPKADFANGFYCSEFYQSALSFVCDLPASSVFVFDFSLSYELKVENFNCNRDWMLAICYFRGMLGAYSEHPLIKEQIDRVQAADLIVAPIADNRMFAIMGQFANGDITDIEAQHALSASRLGKQYVFKTPKAVSCLSFCERLFLSDGEKSHCALVQEDSAREIRTKLKLAKRKFKGQGDYIEDILK